MIEINLLNQLAVLEEAGTLSGAARKLMISQPALSRSMQKLETLMGVPLFERGRNKITLNENGRLAARHARHILEAETSMLEQVRAFDRSNHTISVGSEAPGPNLYFSPILAELYPDMAVAVEMKDEETLLRGLRNDLYQMIFLSHPVSEKGLFCMEAATEHLYLTVLPAHPASSFREITFGDIDGESFLMYTHVGIWDQIVRREMPKSRFLLQEEYEAFGEILDATSLPCFGTNLAARGAEVSNTGKRIAIPFSDPSASITFFFVCRTANRKKYAALTEHFSV